MSETVRAAAEAVAGNPSIATVTSVTLSGAGLTALLAQVSTVLGAVSLIVGIVVGIFVIRVHHLKYKLMMREWEDGSPTKGSAE